MDSRTLQDCEALVMALHRIDLKRGLGVRRERLIRLMDEPMSRARFRVAVRELTRLGLIQIGEDESHDGHIDTIYGPVTENGGRPVPEEYRPSLD